jgi:CrcB protein
MMKRSKQKASNGKELDVQTLVEPHLTVISIAGFGTLGVFSRYYGGILANKYIPSPFPYGTFLVNVVGAFLIGTLYALGNKYAIIPASLKPGLLIGFLGGFTTFSSYCLDAVKLMEEEKNRTAAFYFILSPLLGMFSATLGLVLALWLCGGHI